MSHHDDIRNDISNDMLVSRGTGEADAAYQKLRTLLLGPDYESALHAYISKEDDAERVAAVLVEAIRLSARDPALGKALAPVLNKAIQASIANNPSQITNVIFPIMGPAIRKSVGATLRDMVQNLNRVLEQSLSARGIKWRFKAWRAGVSYGRYVISQTLRFHVEQVLLVHRETGLLLHSVIDEQADARDPELVSSMLTAIQDFVQDSFEHLEGSGLSRIELGDLTLHLCSGPSAVLAAAVRGTINESALSQIDETCEDLHRDFSAELNDFSGDRDHFLRSEDYLRRCLLSERIAPQDEQGKAPWLAIVVLSAIALVLAWFGTISYLESRETAAILSGIENEPGYVLLHNRSSGNTLKVMALRDYRARDPQALEGTLPQQHLKLNLQTTTVTLGAIDAEAILAQAKPSPTPSPSLWEQYTDRRKALNDTYFLFDENANMLRVEELPKLARTLEDMRKLQRLSSQIGVPAPQILLMGLADPSGTQAANIRISQQRAEMLHELFRKNGIEEGLLIAWGLGDQTALRTAPSWQRRVSLQVIDTVDGVAPSP